MTRERAKGEDDQTENDDRHEEEDRGDREHVEHGWRDGRCFRS